MVNVFTFLSTAYVELENTTNEVMEGSDLEVCLLAQGYNYSLVLVVDYSNHGAGMLLKYAELSWAKTH